MDILRCVGPVARALWRRLALLALPLGLALGLAILGGRSVPAEADTIDAPPLAWPSIQAYTGLWDMPNARVLGDWRLRLKYGNADVYHYYGGAIGLFDRFEFSGQFTEVTTLPGFPDAPAYGDYKDRSAGVKIVLVKEDDLLPQTALSLYDATGTGLWRSRALVFSKLFGPFDVTVGLGQGILAGELGDPGTSPDASGSDADGALDFLLSDPFRRTRIFGGVDYAIRPDLVLSAEYSSINYDNVLGGKNLQLMPGYQRDAGEVRTNINLGLKYRLWDSVYLQAGLMRGRDPAFGVNGQFDMEPEGILVWKKPPAYVASERLRWRAEQATNAELAALMAKEVQEAGFSDAEASASDSSLWVAAENSQHQSNALALGRLARVLDELAPERITTFYINLKNLEQNRQSLRTSRSNLRAFLDSRLDKEGFLALADYRLYDDENRRRFAAEPGVSETQWAEEDAFRLTVRPRVRTFLNNKGGFFLHKGLAVVQASYTPWTTGLFTGSYELTLFNQFDQVQFNPNQEKKATRTDVMLYEERSAPRLGQLAFDQIVVLPWNVLGRVGTGYFESAYAGVGAELFRYFDDGRFGVGLQSEVVRKRDPENDLALREDNDLLYRTAFLNLYADIWPDLGLQAGLKIGRFLAGDPGVRMEIRRTYKYFTLGAWYTVTDTDVFDSARNRGYQEKGVYIRIPFSIFNDSDVRGAFSYAVTSFTQDAGQTVARPRALYPMDNQDTPLETKRHLEEMRQ